MISDESLERRNRDDDEEQNENVVHNSDIDPDADEDENYYEDDVYDDDEDYDENDEEDRRHLYRRKKGFSWEVENDRDYNDLSLLGIENEDDD